MTPLQQLEAKVYASNPELKQLGVGCEIILNGEKFTIINTFNTDELVYCNGLRCIRTFLHKLKLDLFNGEIIGKPPTLVDVLKWFIESENSVEKIINFQTYLLRIWNLDSIYLRDQDEALINFLNNLDNGL